eukprot:m.3172 g.3172  ORF g.3172 m.3172 type:complete len:63 (+) comp3711_c1_seq1:56-244(+)
MVRKSEQSKVVVVVAVVVVVGVPVVVVLVVGVCHSLELAIVSHVHVVDKMLAARGQLDYCYV